MTSFYITIYTICGIYLLLNFKFEIQMFQQNSYRIPRYWKWLKGNFGSAWRLVDIAALFLVFSTLLTAPLAAIAVSLIALVKIWLIFRKKYKKPSYSPAGYGVFIPLRQFSPSELMSR